MNLLNCNFEWDVNKLFCDPQDINFAVIILNRGLKAENSNDHILQLWMKACVRLCVDGGANQLYACTEKQKKTHKSKLKQENGESISNNSSIVKTSNADIPLPHIISGDFDSIDHEILNHYESLGVSIIPTPDQNLTDFNKSLLVLRDHLDSNNIQLNHVIVVAGINTERFDHALAHVSTLFKVRSLFTFPVVMLCGESLFWLLEPGTHSIQIPSHVARNPDESWCGYAAFSHPVTATTSGLKWNIENKEVGFECLTSTSNTYSSDFDGRVGVKCSGPLLWFMGWSPAPKNL